MKYILLLSLLLLVGCQSPTERWTFSDGTVYERYDEQPYNVVSVTGLKIGIDPQTRIPTVWIGHIDDTSGSKKTEHKLKVTRKYENINLLLGKGSITTKVEVE